tara:strand:- start:285 stop:488 length:204 start_codon:yes stop_codon:yes gene_type:complete
MSRSIRVGDNVQAYWDANIQGEVVGVSLQKASTWLVGGTIEQQPFCDVKLKSGKVVRLKISDVFHVD